MPVGIDVANVSPAHALHGSAKTRISAGPTKKWN